MRRSRLLKLGMLVCATSMGTMISLTAAEKPADGKPAAVEKAGLVPLQSVSLKTLPRLGRKVPRSTKKGIDPTSREAISHLQTAEKREEAARSLVLTEIASDRARASKWVKRKKKELEKDEKALEKLGELSLWLVPDEGFIKKKLNAGKRDRAVEKNRKGSDAGSAEARIDELDRKYRTRYAELLRVKMQRFIEALERKGAEKGGSDE